MELALNLLWLALALPALWMWRHESVRVPNCPGFARLRPFLVFGCVLMLLFPVVSATDDLHAFGQEMEESGPSKRTVKQFAGDKSLARLGRTGVLPVLISPVPLGSDEVCGQVLLLSVPPHQWAHFHECASRAPPFSSLG
jgi:hypothetical protein